MNIDENKFWKKRLWSVKATSSRDSVWRTALAGKSHGQDYLDYLTTRLQRRNIDPKTVPLDVIFDPINQYISQNHKQLMKRSKQ